MTAKCEVCGEQFEAKRSDARLCSATCRKTASRRGEPQRLREEAKRLEAIQRDERGTVPGPRIDGKATTIPGPYVPTAEREARANEILALRQRAARIEYPVG